MLEAKKLSFEEMLEMKGFIAYTCVGVSMMPLLRQKKDIVEIRPLNERPQKYDVVLYKRNGNYILHRVLKIIPEGGYLIAGDHNTFLERDVTDQMILGKLVRIIRGKKSIYPTDWRYRVYVHLWCDVYPVRCFLLRCKSFIRKRLQKE